MAFIYKPIEPNSIRLLRLEPGTWSSEICCELYHASLINPHPYEALSYCWGSTADRRQIRLNTHPQFVTKNLETALRHIRLEDRSRTLWVDALCINQESFDDKNVQVKMMDEIYRRASHVISWLGEASDNSDEAMTTMGEMGRWMRDNESKIFDASDEEAQELSIIQYFEAKGFAIAGLNWSAVLSLLERPYWTRVWIIQELAVRGFLYKSSGEIICGSSSVQRSEFDVACSAIVLISQGSSIRAASSGVDLDEPLRSILARGWPPGLSMIQTISSCHGLEKPTLTSLLEISRRFEASNRRDKVFALLSLVCRPDRLLEPDYHKSLSATLQGVVQFLVKSWDNLHILLGNRFEVNPDGPSWTPDLGSRLRGDITLRTFNKMFKADNGQSPRVEFDTTLGTLKCEGISLGAVKRVIGPFRQGEKLPDGVDVRQAATEAFGNRQFIKEITDFCHSLTQKDKVLLCKTLVMDHDSSTLGEDGVYPAPEEFVDMMQVLFEQKSLPHGLPHNGSPEARLLQYIFPFTKSMENASSNRCFFITEGGSMGMGPYSMNMGDIIAVFFGSPFCLVLRLVEGTNCYNLIGDAYVHGVMDGEFVKDVMTSACERFVLV